MHDKAEKEVDLSQFGVTEKALFLASQKEPASVLLTQVNFPEQHLIWDENSSYLSGTEHFKRQQADF